MKVSYLLPLAALGTAFIIPEPEMMSQIAIEEPKSSFEKSVDKAVEKLPSPIRKAWKTFEHSFFEKAGCAKHKFDDAMEEASETVTKFGNSFDEAFDYQSWLEYVEENIGDVEPPMHPHHDGPCGKGKPNKHGDLEELDMHEKHGRHGKHGKHSDQEGFEMHEKHGKHGEQEESEMHEKHGKHREHEESEIHEKHDSDMHEQHEKHDRHRQHEESAKHGKPQDHDEDSKPHHRGKPSKDGKGKPGKGKKPRHHTHHHPNETVYEIISNSKYTTVLAKLINEYDDLVELLNGTAANYTIFAPTDKAFEKIPKDLPKPSKEDLKNFLTYHVSPEFYPAGKVLGSRTIPTLLKAPGLGYEPQRLSTQVGFKGLSINFYSRVVAIDIFGTNGVIHGVDSILVPPPKVIDILKVLPGEFSTLDLALVKTRLAQQLNESSCGTIFAPSNDAFKRLGPKINAFLFSSYGEKYLHALLEYHLVPDFALYSDALYTPESKDEVEDIQDIRHFPKGHSHVDLPTSLPGKSLAIDVARFGRIVDIKINGHNHVAIADGIANDGVIHVINSILVPPKKLGMISETEEDLTVEEFKERLEPFLKEDDKVAEDEDEWSIDL